MRLSENAGTYVLYFKTLVPLRFEDICLGIYLLGRRERAENIFIIVVQHICPNRCPAMHEITKRGEEKAYGKFTTGTDH